LEETPQAARKLVGDWQCLELPHFVAGVSMPVGVLGLIVSFAAEESDGSKSIAGALQAVGFLLLAGVLNSYF
jgi:hypothetical protein